MVAYRNAMGIASEIAKHRHGTRHGYFDINDPGFPTQRLEKSAEGFGIAEAELVSAIGTFQAIEKLTSKRPSSEHRVGERSDTVVVPNGCGREQDRRLARGSGCVDGGGSCSKCARWQGTRSLRRGAADQLPLRSEYSDFSTVSRLETSMPDLISAARMACQSTLLRLA